MGADENTTENLSSPQRKVMAALLEGMTVAQAAHHAEVGVSTVYRWLQQPLFSSILKTAEQSQFGEVSRSLGAVGISAVATLAALKDDAEVPAGIRVRAASELLAKQLQARQLILSGETLEVLAQRLIEVEDALATLRQRVKA
jgi:transposase-like protein